jgi:hypothetical protein
MTGQESVNGDKDGEKYRARSQDELLTIRDKKVVVHEKGSNPNNTECLNVSVTPLVVS